MLILTRRADEAIRINDDVEITVLSIMGDQVKLGINAPRHVLVHREEVYRKIQEETDTLNVTFNPELTSTTELSIAALIDIGVPAKTIIALNQSDIKSFIIAWRDVDMEDPLARKIPDFKLFRHRLARLYASSLYQQGMSRTEITGELESLFQRKIHLHIKDVEEKSIVEPVT